MIYTLSHESNSTSHTPRHSLLFWSVWRSALSITERLFFSMPRRTHRSIWQKHTPKKLRQSIPLPWIPWRGPALDYRFVLSRLVPITYSMGRTISPIPWTIHRIPSRFMGLQNGTPRRLSLELCPWANMLSCVLRGSTVPIVRISTARCGA